MDSRLTLLNYYHFGLKRLHYKLPEHHLRNFEKMAIIEQAVNKRMHDIKPNYRDYGEKNNMLQTEWQRQQARTDGKKIANSAELA